MVLINPKIVEKSEEQFIFPEGCLSFPNDKIRTQRHVSVVVEADNHEGKLSFSADGEDINDAFECVCVQHEIDHLDGLTMFDRQYVAEPYRAPKVPGRNERVTITDGAETKELKYKKAERLLESGWTLVEV
jgi:peptide deformylase